MATALDAALRKVAKGVLGALGTAVSIRVVTAGSYDTTTGSATDTTADTTCMANLHAITARELFGQAEVDDQMCVVAASALSAAPRPRDQVVIGSAVYDIIEVRRYQVRDQDAAYGLVIRGPLP
jgi:hypothetical protein